MQLNIIHLKERIDRFQLLENQIYEQHIQNYKIWEGVRNEKNPKKGIANAHKQIIKWALDQNSESIMIAEDDIKFTAPGAFEYFIKNEPQEYDLYLGGVVYGNINPDNTVNEFSGLHFYIIKKNFYDTFLSISEDTDIDRSFAKKGKFVVCNPFVAIQHSGFSDNQQRYQNHERFYKTDNYLNNLISESD